MNGVLENAAMNFLLGAGTDASGRTFDDYMQFDDATWEKCHDHIQWAFPSVLPSRFNPNAPVITWDFMCEFTRERANDLWAIRRNVLKLLQRYKKSIGLISYEDGKYVIPDVSIESWAAEGFNHNFNRISRVLLCQRVFGLMMVSSDLVLSFNEEILPEIVYPNWHNDHLVVAFGVWMEAHYCGNPWSFGK